MRAGFLVGLVAVTTVRVDLVVRAVLGLGRSGPADGGLKDTTRTLHGAAVSHLRPGDDDRVHRAVRHRLGDVVPRDSLSDDASAMPRAQFWSPFPGACAVIARLRRRGFRIGHGR
jgi:hypothetical protein